MKTVLAKNSRYNLSSSHLKEGAIFGALSSEGIQYLLDQGVLYDANKGDEIFCHGNQGQSFYAVLHGNLDFYKHHKNNKTRTRNISFGEAIGFVSMIALHERVGSLYALEDCLLLEISSELFSDFHDEFPFDFGILLMNLSRDMARTIRALSNALVENNVSIKKV